MGPPRLGRSLGQGSELVTGCHPTSHPRGVSGRENRVFWHSGSQRRSAGLGRPRAASERSDVKRTKRKLALPPAAALRDVHAVPPPLSCPSPFPGGASDTSRAAGVCAPMLCTVTHARPVPCTPLSMAAVGRPRLQAPGANGRQMDLFFSLFSIIKRSRTL